MLETAMWCLSLVLMLIGVAGVLLPLLPGTTLILLAAIAHKLVLPGQISWIAIAVIGLFWLLSIAADFGGVMVGTRWFGGSKWGMAGAGGGALVGMFFSLRALVLGTVIGAVMAEKFFAHQSNEVALKAGFGAAVGFVLSTIARLGCAVAMIGAFVVSAATG